MRTGNKWQHYIMESRSLEELCDRLKEFEAWINEDVEDPGERDIRRMISASAYWVYHLPSFGGKPVDKPAVISWNESSLLVIDGPNYEIIPRLWD